MIAMTVWRSSAASAAQKAEANYAGDSPGMTRRGSGVVPARDNAALGVNRPAVAFEMARWTCSNNCKGVHGIAIQNLERKFRCAQALKLSIAPAKKSINEMKMCSSGVPSLLSRRPCPSHILFMRHDDPIYTPL